MDLISRFNMDKVNLKDLMKKVASKYRACLGKANIESKLKYYIS